MPRYVLPKTIPDVSEALNELLEKDFLGPVGNEGEEWASGVFLDKNNFRRYHCYTEQVPTSCPSTLRLLPCPCCLPGTPRWCP